MEKRGLSWPMQWLIERCQETNFGRITVFVRDGEPDLSRPIRLLRTIKLSGGENGPRTEAGRDNFTLRHEHTAMVAQVSSAPNGATVTIEVKHGLPFLIEVEHDYRAA